MSELDRRVRLGVLEAPAGRIFHFKHGWIPIDHEDAGEARKGVATPDGGKVRLRTDTRGNHIVETQGKSGGASWTANRFTADDKGAKAAKANFDATRGGGAAGAAKEQSSRMHGSAKIAATRQAQAGGALKKDDPVHVVTPQGHVINGVVEKGPESYGVTTSRGNERSTTVAVKWDDGDVTHERPQDVQRGHRAKLAGAVKPKEISVEHLRKMAGR